MSSSVKIMSKLSAEQARKQSEQYADECAMQMSKIMHEIHQHTLRGLFTFVYTGKLCEKVVDELKELGYSIFNGNNNTYENFWYIKW
jgi:hypothetical protein